MRTNAVGFCILLLTHVPLVIAILLVIYYYKESDGLFQTDINDQMVLHSFHGKEAVVMLGCHSDLFLGRIKCKWSRP